MLCTLTVIVQELWIQNFQFMKLAKLRFTLWSQIKINFLNLHLQKQHKYKKLFYCMKVEGGNMFNEEA